MSNTASLNVTVGYRLAQVCHLHRQRAEVLLNQLGLHVGQEMFLYELWSNEGITQTEMAERLLLQPATVTNTLQRLEREGFVERRSDTEDQRISRVYVTDKGRNMEAPFYEKWNQLEQESFQGLSIEEQVLLRRLLLQVYQNLAGRE